MGGERSDLKEMTHIPSDSSLDRSLAVGRRGRGRGFQKVGGRSQTRTFLRAQETSAVFWPVAFSSFARPFLLSDET